MSASILILTRDRLEKLKRCLARLAPQLKAGDEVVVIDTGSKDATLEWLAREAPPGVRLERFTGPGSWAEARNFGVASARNPLLAFLDDDCYAAPDWIARGKAALRQFDAAGGMVLPHEIREWPEWWHPEMGWLVGLSVPGHLGADAGRIYYPFTANLWVRAAAARAEPFQELGGSFSPSEGERYILGREDAEWWRRLRVRGYATGFDPRVRVEHDIPRARIDPAYLEARARADAIAWARREGAAGDLDAAAYAVCALRWPSRPNAAEAAEPTRPQRELLARLAKTRAETALRALSEKIAAEGGPGPSAMSLRQNALLAASARVARDRAKTRARQTALMFDPPRRAPLPASPPDRIAVFASGFVGDLVILQSVLRGVLEAHPNLRVAILGPPPGKFIFGNLARVELPCDLPADGDALNGGERIIKAALQDFRPQAVLAPYLHGPWGTAFARARGIAAPVIGFENDEGLARMLDRERIPHRVAWYEGESESARLARLFEAAALPSRSLPAEMRPDASSEAWAARFLASAPEPARALPLLMLNPDAGQSMKEWPEESWLAALPALAAELPHAFIVNSSRARPEFEARLAALNPSLARRIIPLPGASLDHLIAVLARCEGIISVDSGPVHLAHALGIPSLTLFGARDPRRWGNAFHRPIHAILRKGAWDLTPEETRGLPENHLMRLISPEMLMAAARDWKMHLKSA